MKELTLPATIENIETVIDFVNGQLEEIKCPLKAQMQIDIAIDELFGNIAHYAYNPETGPARSRTCGHHQKKFASRHPDQESAGYASPAAFPRDRRKHDRSS